MSKLPQRLLILVSSFTFALGCTASDGATGQPRDTGDTKAKASTAKVRVASVQMIEDCPDREEPDAADVAAIEPPSEAPTEPEFAEDEPPPSAGAPAQPYVAGKHGGGSFEQPCSQSTMQLSLETDGEAPVKVEITGVRLAAKGRAVGTVESRKPKIWTDSRYAAWDQMLAPGAASKISYKLGLPNWAAVERAIEADSYGYMFTLEIDIAIDGEIQTVRSPEFPREEVHVIAT